VYSNAKCKYKYNGPGYQLYTAGECNDGVTAVYLDNKDITFCIYNNSMAIAGCTNDNIVRCNHYALDACYPTDDYAAIQWQIYNPPPENY
jgi:hypothetical protein